jgi:hypothetical protein
MRPLVSELSTNCVVCGTEIHPFRDAPHYANAYEKVRKKAPCCSAECAGKFNPDQHWLPAELPTVLDGKPHERLLVRTRNRLIVGEPPRAVIRDALLGGIPASVLRLALAEIVAAREQHVEKQETRQIKRGILSFLFGRGHAALENTDEGFDPRRLAEAHADLESWDRALERARQIS